MLQDSTAGKAFLAAVGASAPLPGPERVTVFAPTNAAFEAVIEAAGGDVPPAILADVRPTRLKIVSYMHLCSA